MSHGLSEIVVERSGAVLARFPEVEKAVLYGSRAMETHRRGSDIDLTLVGEVLDQSALAQIEDALDDLLLPYKIDLSACSSITLHSEMRKAGRQEMD